MILQLSSLASLLKVLLPTKYKFARCCAAAKQKAIKVLNIKALKEVQIYIHVILIKISFAFQIPLPFLIFIAVWDAKVIKIVHFIFCTTCALLTPSRSLGHVYLPVFRGLSVLCC